ncbi:MAG: cyclase, partial [Phycisphaerales bacterium]|nr:cyclase [Phycisphaerales bacterium]
MPRFVKQSAIDAPARAVFAWHQRPDALAQLTPPWERVTIVRAAPSLAEGGRAEILLHMGPLRLRWVAEHRGFIDRGDTGGEG